MWAVRRTGWLLVAVAAAGGLAAVGISAAAACVPFPLVTVPPPATGPPGTKVTLTGSEFPDSNPVEVRWNAADGPTIATAMGPQFSVEVPIPESPAGLNTFVVLSRATDGAVSGKAAAIFYVTGGDGSGPPPPTTATPARAEVASGDGIDTGMAVVVGAGLLALGLLGGSALANRRTAT